MHPEKHENGTALDSKREELLNVYGISCADSACVGCILRCMHVKHYMMVAFQRDGKYETQKKWFFKIL